VRRRVRVLGVVLCDPEGELNFLSCFKQKISFDLFFFRDLALEYLYVMLYYFSMYVFFVFKL